MTVQWAPSRDEHAYPIWDIAGCTAGSSYTITQRCRLFAILIAAGILSPLTAFAQTGNCRVTHIDYHERRAIKSVEALITAPNVLSSFPYVPVSSARRKLGQSEAARIAPDILTQNPDVVIVHGSTFTGAANPRLVLGELIRSIDLAKKDIRGFVVYSSAPLDAAALSIDGVLRRKLVFMDAPIVNRFRPPHPSAEALKDQVRHLCGT